MKAPNPSALMNMPKELPHLVRDLMTVGVPTCSPTIPVIDLVRKMLENDWEAVIVLDPEEGHGLGVISQEEIVSAFERADLRELRAEDVMRDEIPQVPPDIPLTTAAQIMQDLRVRSLFLMHHSAGIVYPAAMLSYRHILRYLSARNAEELSDLGIQAERQTPMQAFIQKRDALRKKNLSASKH